MLQFRRDKMKREYFRNFSKTHGTKLSFNKTTGLLELIVCHYVITGTAMALSLLRFKCKSNYLTVIQGTGPTAVRFQDHYRDCPRLDKDLANSFAKLLALLSLRFINKLPAKIFHNAGRVRREFSSGEYH